MGSVHTYEASTVQADMLEYPNYEAARPISDSGMEFHTAIDGAMDEQLRYP